MTVFARRRCDRSVQLREHAALVRKIAGRVSARAPSNVGMDELMQAGLIGLNEAMSRYDGGQGAQFDTYASRRIEGAMLDTLRAADTLSRDARARQRQIRDAVRTLEHSLLRPPRAQEVADALGWSLRKFHDAMVEAGAAGVRREDDRLEYREAEVSGEAAQDEALHSVDEQADPLAALQRSQRGAALAAAVEALDERERLVMQMLYERGLDQSEVAEALGLSPARLSQIHAGIVDKLRRRLRDW